MILSSCFASKPQHTGTMGTNTRRGTEKKEQGGAWKEGDSPRNIRIVLEGGRTRLNKVHAALPVERAARAYTDAANRLVHGGRGMHIVTCRVSGPVRDLDSVVATVSVVFLLLDGVVALLCEGIFFCAGAGEFEEFGASGAGGVGPVGRAFGVGDAASDFVEQIGRGYRPVEGGYEMRGERVEGLRGRRGAGVSTMQGKKGWKATYAGEEENLVGLPVDVHFIGVGAGPAVAALAVGGIADRRGRAVEVAAAARCVGRRGGGDGEQRRAAVQRGVGQDDGERREPRPPRLHWRKRKAREGTAGCAAENRMARVDPCAHSIHRSRVQTQPNLPTASQIRRSDHPRRVSRHPPRSRGPIIHHLLPRLCTKYSQHPLQATCRPLLSSYVPCPVSPVPGTRTATCSAACPPRIIHLHAPRSL